MELMEHFAIITDMLDCRTENRRKSSLIPNFVRLGNVHRNVGQQHLRIITVHHKANVSKQKKTMLALLFRSVSQVLGVRCGWPAC